MNTLEHHRVFLSGQPYVSTEFNTTDDLLNIPFVQGYTQQQDFRCLCTHHLTLMAVFKTKVMVVGYVADADLGLQTMCELCKEDGFPLPKRCH